jgi:putative tryptophan/tyrosine transport system substrate-binding protein
MNRRKFIALVGGAVAWPMGVRAQQQPGMVHRIGYLSTGSANPRLANPRLLEAFRQGLRELGWVEGQNILVEYRFAEGQSDRLPGLADELVRLKVDVIAASPTPAALAAKNATETIPIVGISFDNPVEHGLVASLARPGGNITGLSYSVGPEIFGKDLELLRELIPEIRHVAVLSNSAGPNHALMISNVQTAARSLGVELLLLEARGPDEFDGAFAAIAKERVGALFVFGDPMFGVHRARLADLAAQNRLPTMYTNRPHVEAGGLLCYGPSFSDLWRRAASYVDKILKGAKPADLPVEQPTKFELVINLKTAKVLGLAIPPSLLARADEVIE